jgi:hypothetical protein
VVARVHGGKAPTDMLSEVHLLKSELDAALGENRDAYWAFFKKVRMKSVVCVRVWKVKRSCAQCTF